MRSDKFKLIFDAVEQREELYDLCADPEELDNLIEGGRIPQREYDELHEALLSLLAEHIRIPSDRTPFPLSPEVIENLRELGYIK